MRKLLVVTAVLGLVVLVGGSVGAAVFLKGGIAANSEPSHLEAVAARKLRSWLIPAAAREQANPIPASNRAFASGRAHFADHCASCHGNDGSGNTQLGRRLYPRAPDMRLPATQDLTDGELFYIIENGVRLTGMPGWGGGGNPEASWHLVHFIRHLPSLTRAEVAEMEALNPRSPDEWRAAEDDQKFLSGEDPPPPPASQSHQH